MPFEIPLVGRWEGKIREWAPVRFVTELPMGFVSEGLLLSRMKQESLYKIPVVNQQASL